MISEQNCREGVRKMNSFNLNPTHHNQRNPPQCQS